MNSFSPETLPAEIVCLESVRSLPAVRQVLSEVENERRVQITAVKSLQEIELVTQSERNFLILLSSTSSVELTACLQWLQSRRKTSIQSRMRVIVFNHIAHPKVAQLLVRQGCQDVIDVRLPARTIERKLRGCIQAFFSPDSKSSSTSREKVNEPLVPRPPAGKTSGASRDREISWESPLDLSSDCWLITDPGLIKFVMGRWMLLILGPGPSAGKWERALSDQQDRQSWEWKPRNLEDDPFIVQPGTWTYSGREPEFVWKFNLWRFVGEQPSLVFKGSDGIPHARFSTLPTKLVICKNSLHAEGKRKLIRDTIEASLQIRGAKSGPVESSTFDEEIATRAAQDYLLEMPSEKEAPDFQDQKDESALLSFTDKKEEVYDREPWLVGTEAFKRMEIDVRLRRGGMALQFISFENQEATFFSEAAIGKLIPEESVEVELTMDEVSPSDGLRVNKERSTLVCKVKRVEQTAEKTSELVLEIPREQTKIFHTIASVVQNRQEEILDFFSQARGF